MTTYSKILKILENSVGGQSIGAHGNFWRGRSRDDFVGHSVFGQKLVTLGDGANSALVKAMRGLAPFGSDVPPSAPGEIFRRMPAGMSEVDASEISTISDWIDNGCPETSDAADGIMSDEKINQFFREFDDFFMFSVSSEVSESIGVFFSGIAMWPGMGGPSRTDWGDFLAEADTISAARHLSTTQLGIFTRHFGDPANLDHLSDAFSRFGAGRLPDDPLRPHAPRHRMDGHTMWNIWIGFASACLQLGLGTDQWRQFAPRIALGAVHDALFRNDRPVGGRLNVTRYNASQPDLVDTIIADFGIASIADLLAALESLSLEMLGLPTPPSN